MVSFQPNADWAESPPLLKNELKLAPVPQIEMAMNYPEGRSGKTAMARPFEKDDSVNLFRVHVRSVLMQGQAGCTAIAIGFKRDLSVHDFEKEIAMALRK